MARLWSCLYFRMPTEASIWDTECAKYYTGELQMVVQDLEKNKDSPLSKALIGGRTCVLTRTGIISKSDVQNKPNKTRVYETIDSCFGDNKNVANRLESAFEEIIGKQEELDISPEMTRLLSCYYFFTSGEEPILDTECAKYYTDEVRTAVEYLERKKVPPLSKALLDGESCARDIMGQVSKNPSQKSVFEIIDYCFGRHKNIANRLKSAFEKIEPKK